MNPIMLARDFGPGVLIVIVCCIWLVDRNGKVSSTTCATDMKKISEDLHKGDITFTEIKKDLKYIIEKLNTLTNEK